MAGKAGRGAAGRGVARRGMAGMEVIMVYVWKDGTRLKADSQKVGEELDAIAGPKTAELVVAHASKGGELHKCFTWDDTAAAHKCRLSEARYLLSHISIVREVDDVKSEEPRKIVVRAYENVKTDNVARAYVPIDQALSTPDMRIQVFSRLNSMISEADKIAENYTYIADEMGEVRHGIGIARSAVERVLAK